MQKIFSRFKMWQIISFPILFLSLLTTIVIFILTINFSTNNLSNALYEINDNTGDSITSTLDNYLNNAISIITSNRKLAEIKLIDIDDEEFLNNFFLTQATMNSSVDFAYYANEEGGIASSGIIDDELRVSFTADMVSGPFNVNRVYDNGDLEFIKSIEFDPRTRDWYFEANNKNEVFWTEVYGGVQEPVLGITSSIPLYDEFGDKLGVFGADILLDDMTWIVNKVDVSTNTNIYIFEQDTDIIVNNNFEQPFFIENSEQIRINKDNFSDDFFEYFVENQSVGNLNERVKINGEFYNMGLYEYRLNDTNIWYIGVAIPESDYNQDLSILLFYEGISFIISLGLLIYILISVMKWIEKPIKLIGDDIEHVAKGNLDHNIEFSRNDVLGKLVNSFVIMKISMKELILEVKNKNSALIKLNNELEDKVLERTENLKKISITDELTGLINRRELFRVLKRETALSIRNKLSISIALIDIDSFKDINDTYGHITGDKVLAELADLLRTAVRKTDIVARYAGDEFIIVFNNSKLVDSANLMNKVRDVLLQSKINDNQIRLTISVGVNEYKGESIEEFIKIADDRMYKAKRLGKNQVVSE